MKGIKLMAIKTMSKSQVQEWGICRSGVVIPGTTRPKNNTTFDPKCLIDPKMSDCDVDTRLCSTIT